MGNSEIVETNIRKYQMFELIRFTMVW